VSSSLPLLNARIESCTRCPRLRDWCTQVAREKRRAYANDTYWGKPVGGFGDPAAALWILGLAPGAHGANRTGRVFTGDRSGDFLYAALHRAGYANQPTSVRRDDGLALSGCYISAAVRCAPPGNKPTPEEIAACAPFVDEELALLRKARVILCLGGIAWAAAVAVLRRNAALPRGPAPRFAHGAECPAPAGLTLVGSYHVSQQNTFTGRLTPAMLDAVLARCRELAAPTSARRPKTRRIDVRAAATRD
jgi:uracil-DNA glycosylase family 4